MSTSTDDLAISVQCDRAPDFPSCGSLNQHLTVRSRRSRMCRVLIVLLCSAQLIIILSIGLSVDAKRYEFAPPPPPVPRYPEQFDQDMITVQKLMLAQIQGVYRTYVCTSTVMCVTAFIVIIFGAWNSAYITAKCDTSRMPFDFPSKGTISNVSQDVGTPHGRIWTAALAVSGLLLLASAYTFWLYRPWPKTLTGHESAIDPYINPLRSTMLAPLAEKLFRSFWLCVPPVLLIITGGRALPTSDAGTLP